MSVHRAKSPQSDNRSEPRDELLHRVRAMRADGTTLSMVIVNASPGGLMARSEGTHEIGDALSVMLPIIGRVRATVRWSLGGRIGCQFDRAIPSALYYEMLAAARR